MTEWKTKHWATFQKPSRYVVDVSEAEAKLQRMRDTVPPQVSALEAKLAAAERTIEGMKIGMDADRERIASLQRTAFRNRIGTEVIADEWHCVDCDHYFHVNVEHREIVSQCPFCGKKSK